MLREFTASIQKQNFTPEQSGDVYDPDKRLKKEAMKKRVEARMAEKKAVSTSTDKVKTLKIYYPYANKNKTINHANSYKQIVEAQNPGLTVELVNNKSQADMVFGRGQGMGNPFSHESSHSEVIVKTRFFDETMIMYEAWLKGEPMPEGTVPITPEQQKRLDALKAEWDNKLKPFVSSSSFETVKRYSVEDLRNNPNKIYIFGDNTEGWGKGGQAIVRDEPNAFGISTKDSPTQFMSDDNFEANKAKIDADIAAIKADGRPIVFPEDGIGTGRADLQNKAPRTWAYLQKELNKLKGDNTKVKTFEVSTKGDDFGKQFSALNATFKEGPYAGRTIEDVWQNEIKKSGKGKPPAQNSILFGKDYQVSKDEYQKLWQMWADENPALITQLKNKVDEGYNLIDSFAGDPNKTVNQAEALSNIVNNYQNKGIGGRPYDLKNGIPVDSKGNPIKSIGSANKNITIYRVVPEGVNTVNPNDWVFINQAQAEEALNNANKNSDGKFNLIEMEVSQGDVYPANKGGLEMGYTPKGSSLGAAKLNDPNVFDEVIEEYTPGNKFIKEIVGNIPGWIIVPIEQAIESGLRMSGYSAAAALAKKLVQWELYTFAVSLGANAIGRGEGALVSPQLAQAHLILGNEEEFRKRAATMEKDMMQNSAEVGSGMMSAIIKAMPSYWKDEWLLKRNPEFTGWMEMFPDLAYVKTKAEKGMDWGIGKLFGNGK